MALSRYRNVNILDKKFFESSDFPPKDVLDSISTFQIVTSKFDRLDNLAHIHLGDGTYWWIIALFNDIDWAYGMTEGQILKIPTSIDDVLRLF